MRPDATQAVDCILNHVIFAFKLEKVLCFKQKKIDVFEVMFLKYLEVM